MNNIYVDELPKSCNECNLGYFYDCQYCFLRPDLADKQEWCEKEKHCPLKLITDRLAEERMMVCDAVYKLTRELMSFGYGAVSLKEVEKVLEKFDRGE